MSGDRTVRRRALATVEARNVEWLDRGMIPFKVVTLVAGVGGLGKSTWLAGVAAKASQGELTGHPVDVLIVSYEDAAEEVLRPRVEAANGDLARVHTLDLDPSNGAGMLTLPADLDEMERHIVETAARLVIVDPIVAAIDLALDAYKDQDVRNVLGELVRVAERTACAVSIVGHLNKTPSRDAYIRVANSTAFWNASRSVVLVTTDPADPDRQRLVTQRKANYARLAPVQRHVLEEIQLDHLDENGLHVVTVRMRYLEDAEDVDREDVLSDLRAVGDEKPLVAALLFLLGTLADGEWHDSAGLKVLARAQGISERTLQRAAGELEVEHDRRGFPSSTWWRRGQLRQGTPQKPGATVDEAETRTVEPETVTGAASRASASGGRKRRD